MPDARNLGDGMVPVEAPKGCWVARYYDWSVIAIFNREIDALRYAVKQGGGMEVEFKEWGEIR